VDSVDVLTLESFPVQINVQVQGNLPDGCTELQEPLVTQTDNTFTVVLGTVRPAEAMCTQALVPYETSVPLDVEGLPAGEYTVIVNGVTGSFTLDVDNQ
jgi:inhibitor of cysteine peptidase